MPIIVACPSCGRKLRVTDALYGQSVRCPTCLHTFDGPVEPEPPAGEPQDMPLDLTIDDPSPPPGPASSGDPGGLIGAIELKAPGEDPPASREREPAPESRRPRPRRTEERGDFDERDLRRLGPRRDAEPDRGTTVLTLGILSLAGLLVWCIPIIGFVGVPVCAILGLCAWIMGQSDLRKMKKGQMDETGRGITQAGWICGILGTLLNFLLLLGCGAFLGYIFYNEMNRPPLTKPVPVPRPPQAPPPPKNPAQKKP